MRRPDERRPGRRASVLALAVLGTAAVTAACGGSGGADAFTVGMDKTCLVHQTRSPTTAYRGGERADTDLELRFLAYYTAQGTERFCDGHTATSRDRDWGALYVDLTGNRAAVTSLI